MTYEFGGSGLVKGVESFAAMFPGRHFLFACSDMHVCCSHSTASQTGRETDRQMARCQ